MTSSWAAPDWGDVIGKGRRLSRRRRLAGEAWRAVRDELAQAGLLHEVDRLLVQSYAVAVAEEDVLVRQIAAQGVTISSMGRYGETTKAHPAIQALTATRTHLKRCRDELGLSPWARSRLGRVPGPGHPPNAADVVIQPEEPPEEPTEEEPTEGDEVVEEPGTVVAGPWDLG